MKPLTVRLRKHWLHQALLFCLSAGLHAGAQEPHIALETRRLHLGKPGQWEWDTYKDRKLDGETFEARFQARANTAENTLRLWHRDVKLNWPVSLNGRKLGSLTTAETAMESVLAIPAGGLKDGDNVLRIDAPGGLDDIEVGPVFITPRPIPEALSGSTIDVTVTDAQSGTGLPCRLTLTRPDGTLQPLRAEPASDVAVRAGVVYCRNGRGTLSMPPGDYVLHAGHGFEWSVARQVLSLPRSAQAQQVRLSLRREVDTQGWIAADSHIHTLTYSGHGDARIEERMLTIAGEGVELAIATDHNHHTDYTPAAAASRVADRFTSVIGNEVTTSHGHFNAFPILPGARVVNHQQDDWSTLVPEIRATPGVKVITLNHPRDLHSGFIPFGPLQFNDRTGSHRFAKSFDFDAMEVVTSAAMQSDIHLLYRDWFALLNAGLRISAIASSDSHDVNRFIVGQGRTYVACDDKDPAKLDLEQVWQSYQKGRLLVSLGLLTTMKVDALFGVGEVATGLGPNLNVEIIVSGPSWVTADHVELFANGILIQEQPLTDDHRAGEKARLNWTLPRPPHDVYLVAIATGPGVTEPFWEIPRPYQPQGKALNPRVIGSTNPIWIDADGDGQYQSAHAIAESLVKKAGGDANKLRESLKGFDAAVSVQAEALSSTGAR